MHRFRKILVGVDLNREGDAVTEGSRAAALQAEWLAEKTGATITLLHSTWTDYTEDHGIIRQGPSPAGAQALEEFASDYAESDVEVVLKYTENRPWISMIRHVLREESDLLIVGKRNVEGGDKRYLGNVSRKLMRKCPCPVWVVEPKHGLAEEEVMVATDLTPVGDLATELGAAIAEACGAHLSVIHAWQVPFALQMRLARITEEQGEEQLGEIAGQAQEHIGAVLDRLELSEPADVLARCDSPSRLIQEQVSEQKPDVLVMGTVSHTGIRGLLIGNTAEKMIDRVNCSLLTIKPEGFVSPVTL